MARRSDCFAAAGLSSVEVRLSSLGTGFSSGAEGLVSAVGGFSSAPMDSLFDGPAISARAVLRLSSAVSRLFSAVTRLSTRAASAPSCSTNIFRSACSPDRRVAIACFVSSCGAGDVSCFDCKVDRDQYSLAGLFAQKNAPAMTPKKQQQPWKHSARSCRLSVMRGSDISGNRLFAISCASRIRAVRSYRLSNFQGESVQVFGRPGEHLSFSIGEKIT